jgi:uncharacterized protein YbaA (DUF1428 family)
VYTNAGLEGRTLADRSGRIRKVPNRGTRALHNPPAAGRCSPRGHNPRVPDETLHPTANRPEAVTVSYVDGFVLPIATKNLTAHRKLARKAAKIWKEHGALAYIEAVGDDMHTGIGKAFPKLLKLKADQSVLFGWVVFRDRKHRDQVNARVIVDKRLQGPLTFELKAMAYGGFKVIADA